MQLQIIKFIELMKKIKAQKENKKFNLEKFQIAKLQNPHLISGGNSKDPTTVTDTLSKKNDKDTF